MSMPLVLQEQLPDDIVLLTLNRPQQRNALNLAMVQELGEKLEILQQAPPAALLITGAGGEAFVAGADVAELEKRKSKEALQQINARLFRQVEAFPSPTLAVIDGYALGGGCELALACDLRIASNESQFAQPEVGLGIIPAAGATYRLARYVGLGRAREMIFTGRRVGALEAQQIGLVNRVVDKAQLRTAALAFAREIAKNAPLAVRLAKVAINAALAGEPALAQLESVAQAVLFESEEKHKRMRAFLSKKATAVGRDRAGKDAATKKVKAKR